MQINTRARIQSKIKTEELLLKRAPARVFPASPKKKKEKKKESLL